MAELTFGSPVNFSLGTKGNVSVEHVWFHSLSLVQHES